jgi:Ca-activated chloride channel family protein
MRTIIVLALMAAGALPVYAQPNQEASAQLDAIFRSSASDLVVLPVTVVDKKGRLVAGLPRERFTVYDNGRRQEVAFFSNEDTPVSIALVIDDSGSMRGKMGQVIAATMAFARWSHPEDELFVIEFNDRVRDALNGRRITAADAAELESALRTLSPEGQTALYNALLDGLEHLEKSTQTRKVLVLISDGGDNASRAKFEDVLDRARRSNVTIYTIGLFDEGAPDTNPGVLKRLAEATGGERFLPKSPGILMQACDQIAREIRSGYTLGYEPPSRDGSYHKLRVEVAGPTRNLVIRTRPGYYAGSSPTP